MKKINSWIEHYKIQGKQGGRERERGETGNNPLVWKLQNGNLYNGIFTEPLKSFLQKNSLCHGEMFMIQQVKNREIIHYKAIFLKKKKEQQLSPGKNIPKYSLFPLDDMIEGFLFPLYFSVCACMLSRSVVSSSLQPHGLQHARLPFHHLPEFAQINIHWVSDAI